jgi:proline dehydrogenase
MFNRMIARIIPLFPKKFIWVFSKKYIAGEKVENAIKVVNELNTKKMLATIDILGESIDSREQAEKYQKLYLETIDRVIKEGLQTSFSLKPTMFGLLRDYDYCFKLIRQIVEKVSNRGYFVRIDMEDSNCTQAELHLFSSLYKEFPSAVGIVLQAYLKRTISDIENLSTISFADKPVNIRLCKGIYNESKIIAYKVREEIRQNYMQCLDSILARRMYPAIATHDRVLTDGALELIQKYKKERNEYEFQMLYGVTPLLRKQLVDKGYTLRVYVPFGEQWLLYSTRRLQENPRMVRDIIMALFIRK